MRDCELTFAEAMALNPRDVETAGMAREGGPREEDWKPLEKNQHFSLASLRMHSFRRARPKSQRIREMADEYESLGDRSSEVVYNSMRCAIENVCRFLHEQKIGPSAAMGPNGLEGAWDAVRREFLVPR
jgi:hypothetical protein